MILKVWLISCWKSHQLIQKSHSSPQFLQMSVAQSKTFFPPLMSSLFTSEYLSKVPSESESCSVVSNSWQLHGIKSYEMNLHKLKLMFYLNILKNSIKYFIKAKKEKQCPPTESAFTMDTGMCRHKYIIGILLQSMIGPGGSWTLQYPKKEKG